MDKLTPKAEREALKALTQSEGWRIFLAHMDTQWGPAACEAQLRESSRTVSPEEWPFESRRILDAFAGMRANVRWPEERLRQLAEGKSAASAFADRFAHLRRRPQTA